MINRISLQVANPLRVAKVLSEIWNGYFFAFPPYPGSYIVFARDDYGAKVVLYPLESEILPGFDVEDDFFAQNSGYPEFIATCTAIPVPISQRQIEQMATLLGWRTNCCGSGELFDVVELWIENRVMLELMPLAIADQSHKIISQHKQLLSTAA